MKSYLRLIFSKGVIITSLLVAVGLTVGVLVLFWYSRPDALPPGASTAVLNIIRVPTFTPTLKIITPIVSESATPDLLTAIPVKIELGASVEVVGTGGAGLRIRQSPGLSQRVLFLANEGEVFVIQDGPRELDGYTWWLLANPEDAARSGWAVADFLRTYQLP